MNYGTYSGYRFESDPELTAAVLSIYGIVFAVLAIFYIISYVLRGIGMYTMGKRMGMENSWLAFIPFGRAYFHGELTGSIKLKAKTIKAPGIWLLVMPVILGAIHFIFYIILVIVGAVEIFSQVSKTQGYSDPVIASNVALGIIVVVVVWGFVVTVYDAAYKVLKTLVNRQIFARFTSPNMAIAHGVLCVILPLYESICFLVFRNKPFNEGMDPNIGTPFRQPVPPAVSVMPMAPEGMPKEAVQTAAGEATDEMSGEKAEEIFEQGTEGTKLNTEPVLSSVIIPPAPEDEVSEEVVQGASQNLPEQQEPPKESLDS